jgi:hypothetical protein
MEPPLLPLLPLLPLPEALPPLAEELPPLADEPLLVPDPELLPLEVLPLEPLSSVDPSLPPVVVEPPHCNEGTNSVPRSAMHSGGHFGRTIIANLPLEELCPPPMGDVETVRTIRRDRRVDDAKEGCERDVWRARA